MYATWEIIGISLIVLVVLIMAIAAITTLMKKKEGMQFRVSGRKNKRECQNYHLKLYWDCIKNSGGYDTNGNCWANTEPNLVACAKDYF